MKEHNLSTLKCPNCSDFLIEWREDESKLSWEVSFYCLNCHVKYQLISDECLQKLKYELDEEEMMREEIQNFAEEMERVMEDNSQDKGESWKRMSLGDLNEKLKEELEEWDDEIYSKEELVDIADCCMMLWNRLDQEEVQNDESLACDECGNSEVVLMLISTPDGQKELCKECFSNSEYNDEVEDVKTAVKCSDSFEEFKDRLKEEKL